MRKEKIKNVLEDGEMGSFPRVDAGFETIPPWAAP